MVKDEHSALQGQASSKDIEKTTDDWQRTTDALRKAEESAQALKAISTPFLNWAGKAERLSFGVPTLPLVVHERLSTKAIIDTRVIAILRGKYDQRGGEVFGKKFL